MTRPRGAIASALRRMPDFQRLNSAALAGHARLGCQVAHASDAAFSFFDPASIPGDCGTLAVVDDVLFAPAFNPESNAVGSIGAFTPFTPVSQSEVSLSGVA